MRQKDIFLARLDPTKGSEQSGMRPVVIISGAAMNNNLDVCIVCPFSSKIKNYASCVALKKSAKNGLSQNSEIITFYIRSISHSRLVKN